MIACYLMPPAHAASSEPANFVQWRAGLASSAQPDADYLKRAKALGYDVVINLAPPEYKEAVDKEGSILAAQGITYINIPVNFSNPAPEDFRVFTEIMKTVAKKKVLVHCQVNLRGSSFVFLYRVLHEGAAMDEARAKLNSVWVPNTAWKRIIEGELFAGGKKADIF
ncbi:MAG: protein tyrosine phosphatase family protein [Betaproteobacteria bacterium]